MRSHHLYFTVLLFILLGCPFLSITQSNSLNPIDRLERQFNRYELAPDQLVSFDKRAQQKLTDLADYLNIIHNPNYDQELREQAQDMLANLFVDRSKVSKPFKGKNTITIQHIKEHSPFVRIDNFYQKELVFEWKETLTKGKAKVKRMKAVIILKQVKQQFGKEQALVWKVFLSTIS